MSRLLYSIPCSLVHVPLQIAGERTRSNALSYACQVYHEFHHKCSDVRLDAHVGVRGRVLTIGILALLQPLSICQDCMIQQLGLQMMESPHVQPHLWECKNCRNGYRCCCHSGAARCKHNATHGSASDYWSSNLLQSPCTCRHTSGHARTAAMAMTWLQ